MKSLKAGVFGIGDVAMEYIKSVQLHEGAEVAAVVGRDRKKTQARIDSLGLDCDVLDHYEKLIERKDLDFIIITSPHFLHAQETIMAAEAGKHVICEKPIGMNAQESKEVYEAVKKAGVHFQCGMVLRWNPMIMNLKNMIESRVFGNLFYIEMDYFHKLSSAWNGFSWGGQKRSGGPSASLVAGIHAVDLMRYLNGEVQRVHAEHVWGHRKDFEYPPTYVATMKFANGAVGKTSCSFEIESPYLVNILLHGSKGSVAGENFYFQDVFPGQTGWQRFETIMPDSGAVSHHPFEHLIADFIESVNADRPTMLNIEETYRSHNLCMAIDQSIERGETVKLS